MEFIVFYIRSYLKSLCGVDLKKYKSIKSSLKTPEAYYEMNNYYTKDILEMEYRDDPYSYPNRNGRLGRHDLK